MPRHTGPTVAQLQEDLLRKHGFVGRGMNAIGPVTQESTLPPAIPHNGIHKSAAMRLVELRFGKPIEEILALSRKGGDVARVIGVDAGTISKWRKALGLTPTRGRPKIERADS